MLTWLVVLYLYAGGTIYTIQQKDIRDFNLFGKLFIFAIFLVCWPLYPILMIVDR